MAEVPGAEPRSRAGRLPRDRGRALPALAAERQYGSAQESRWLALQAIMSGAQKVVIAPGVESRLCPPVIQSVTANASGPHR